MGILEVVDRNKSDPVKLVMDRFLGSEIIDAPMNDSVIPGVFFLLLGLTWFQQHLCCSTLHSFPLTRVLAFLPWTAIISLVLSGLAILASMTGHFKGKEDERSTVSMVNHVFLYLAFALPGLLSTLSFYSTKSRLALPRHSPLLATSLAFLLELLLPPASCPLLLPTISACALISVARFLLSSSPSSPSCLLLCLLTQVQGSWLLHTSLSPPSPIWQATYFSWHVLGTFALYITASLALQALFHSKPAITKVEGSLQTSSASPTDTLASSSTVSTSVPVNMPPPKFSLNTSTLQFVKEKEFKDFIKENPNIKEFIKDKKQLMSPRTFEIQEKEDNKTRSHRASQLVRVLDCEPCDRVSSQGSNCSKELQGDPREEIRRNRRNSIDRVLDSGLSRMHSLEGLVERVSPLEEFNTLHRNQSSVRASIKLKESDLV